MGDLYPSVGEVQANIPLYDSHCHLQLDPIFENREEVLKNASAVGVSVMAVCGVCPGEDWERVLTLVRQYPDRIIANYGLHPWWIRKHITSGDNVSSGDWNYKLEELLLQNLKAGVGECGLDKNITSTTPLEEQESILLRHIQLARQYQRPLTIHCVGYRAKLLEILKREYQLSTKKNRSERDRNPPLILHSCNSMPVDMVAQYCKINAPVYFSLSGGASADKTIKLLQSIPRDVLL